jgi:hypothetical protein
MTVPTASGQADHGPTKPRPSADQNVAGQTGHARDRTLLIIALTLPLAGIITLLIAFQPFAGASGGCGGG